MLQNTISKQIDIDEKTYLDELTKSLYNAIEKMGCSIEDFIGKRRFKYLVYLRTASAHYLISNFLYDKKIHYSHVEKIFNRDRTTIFNHYVSNAQNLLQYDDDFKLLYGVFVEVFNNKNRTPIVYEEETLSSIQDDYAVVKGYDDFKDLLTHNISNPNNLLTHIYEYSICL